MGWTKKEYILEAFDVLGLSSYSYDLSQEQLQSALRKLDNMIIGWNSNGIRIAWAIFSTPTENNINLQTSAPDIANEAICYNLAIRLAPSFGKSLSPEILTIANDAYTNLVTQVSSFPKERDLPSSLPLGAGNKTWRTGQNAFIVPNQDTLDAGTDGELNFE